MRLVLAAVATAVVLAGAPSQALAWACRADGLGSTAMGYGPTAQRAKFVALRRCERDSLLHVCTIRWCSR
jgi:hypothetical protein